MNRAPMPPRPALALAEPEARFLVRHSIEAQSQATGFASDWLGSGGIANEVSRPPHRNNCEGLRHGRLMPPALALI